jgi:hypothetical protein
MGDIPDSILLNRHRDLDGRWNDIWIRRGLFTLVALVPVLALLNLFGQRPDVSSVDSPAATLQLASPPRVRSGLLYQARFRLTAHRSLEQATLVLSRGWLEGMTINTIEPSPVHEASADGNLSLELGHIAGGSTFALYMQFQTNPTNVGHRDQTVRLYDGERELLELHRTVTVFP